MLAVQSYTILNGNDLKRFASLLPGQSPSHVCADLNGVLCVLDKPVRTRKASIQLHESRRRVP